MPKKSALPEIEIRDYYDAHQLACECLTDAVSKLRKRNRLSDDAAEISNNERKILELRADKALLVAKRLAFDANRDGVNPPTDQQFEKLNGLTATVDAFNPNVKIFPYINQATMGCLAIFSEIHPNVT